MSTLNEGAIIQNRYRVVRQIGQGGFGAVYEAVDQRLNSRVALKQLLLVGDEVTRAFRREAELLANLRHPALPNVMDFFTEETGQFLVMQYIPGDDLAALLAQRGTPFPVDETRHWADQLLGALNYLHTRTPPVLHRDIKPQNLKLVPPDEIVLLDFGLAKGSAVVTAGVTTGRSIMAYTPGFAPLEQIQGQGTTAQSDLYALAATLHYLLTNVQPVDAITRSNEMRRRQTDPLRPVHELNPRVPEAVSGVLMAALALDAEDRPATAAEMRAALKEGRALPPSTRKAAEPVVAPPPPLPGEEQTVVASLPPVVAKETQGDRLQPKPADATVHYEAERPKATARHSRWALWVALGGILLLAVVVAGVAALRASSTGDGRPVAAGAGLSGSAPEPDSVVGAGATEITAAADSAIATPISEDDAYAEADGAAGLSGRIAFVSDRDGDSEIYVMNADGSNLVQLTDNDAEDEGPAWSPDGQRIAFTSDRDDQPGIYVMNPDGTEPSYLPDTSGDDYDPAWSPDGKQIIFTSQRDGNAEIYVVNADGSYPTRLTDNGEDNKEPPWSPGGEQITFCSDHGESAEIYVVNADGSDPTSLTSSELWSCSPAWSPDGQQIAFFSDLDDNDGIHVMDTDGSDIAHLGDSTAGDYGPSWAPDGGHIVFYSDRDDNSEIYVMNADGTDVTPLTDTESDVDNYEPARSPVD